MDQASFMHEPKSAYAYAAGPDTLHLRVRTRKHDVKSVCLLALDPFNWRPSAEDPEKYEFAADTVRRIPMKLDYTTELHDYWFAELDKIVWRRAKYGFVLEGEREGETWFAGCHGFVELGSGWEPPTDHTNYYSYPFLLEADLYRAPEWVEETVWYQIFPDRFRRGSGEEQSGLLPWGSDDRDGNEKKFGGDLRGVIEKLDYIRELGCSGIYFTPIFDSPSSHKYDTRDYLRIDPDFGDNEIFGTLVQEAHKRGIRVMLDAVFNHCGEEHPFWQDVLSRGQASPYYDYFYVLDPERPIETDTSESLFGENLNYRTFGYAPSMPKWNTDHPEAREYLLQAAEYWTKAYGIDGWRLDVANEVSHSFWREFRQRIKAINPELYILGENWQSSNPWLLGDQFDAVMNYELQLPVTRFFGAQPAGAEQQSYGERKFVQEISRLLVEYPRHVAPNLFNLLDSHDTPRILTVCGGDWRAAALAYVFLLTYAGSPSIYYGGEVGLGGDEHHNRQCMPWESERQNADLHELIARLIRLRSRHSSFRSLDIRWLAADEQSHTLIYAKSGKGTEESILYVILHRSPEACEIELPAECADREFQDLLHDRPIHTGRTLKLEPYAVRLFA